MPPSRLVFLFLLLLPLGTLRASPAQLSLAKTYLKQHLLDLQARYPLEAWKKEAAGLDSALLRLEAQLPPQGFDPAFRKKLLAQKKGLDQVLRLRAPGEKLVEELSAHTLTERIAYKMHLDGKPLDKDTRFAFEQLLLPYQEGSLAPKREFLTTLKRLENRYLEIKTNWVFGYAQAFLQRRVTFLLQTHRFAKAEALHDDLRLQQAFLEKGMADNPAAAARDLEKLHRKFLEQRKGAQTDLRALIEALDPEMLFSALLETARREKMEIDLAVEEKIESALKAQGEARMGPVKERLQAWVRLEESLGLSLEKAQVAAETRRREEKKSALARERKREEDRTLDLAHKRAGEEERLRLLAREAEEKKAREAKEKEARLELEAQREKDRLAATEKARRAETERLRAAEEEKRRVAAEAEERRRIADAENEKRRREAAEEAARLARDRKEAERLSRERLEAERLAAEKRRQEEKLAADRKREEERLAAEKRREEEKRQLEEERRKREEERLALERKREEERLARERKAEAERLAREKKAEEERLALERKREEERIAEERRREEQRLALERQREAARLLALEEEKRRAEAERKARMEKLISSLSQVSLKTDKVLDLDQDVQKAIGKKAPLLRSSYVQSGQKKLKAQKVRFSDTLALVQKFNMGMERIDLSKLSLSERESRSAFTYRAAEGRATLADLDNFVAEVALGSFGGEYHFLSYVAPDNFKPGTDMNWVAEREAPSKAADREFSYVDLVVDAHRVKKGGEPPPVAQTVSQVNLPANLLIVFHPQGGIIRHQAFAQVDELKLEPGDVVDGRLHYKFLNFSTDGQNIYLNGLDREIKVAKARPKS